MAVTYGLGAADLQWALAPMRVLGKGTFINHLMVFFCKTEIRPEAGGIPIYIEFIKNTKFERSRMLKVWGRRSSFNVQKVLWLVGELGLAHEHILAGGSFGVKDTAEFLAMNPHGRVPLIDDNATIVWESHAILRYLAARYGKPDFWSEDPALQSQADRWMDWSQTSLQPAFLTGVFWGFYRTPPEQRNRAAIEKSLALCTQYFRLLDQVLSSQPFIAGERLTLADIPAGTALYRYFELEIERPSLPNVEAWYERLQQRAAYQAHVMIPFDELRGRLDY